VWENNFTYFNGFEIEEKILNAVSRSDTLKQNLLKNEPFPFPWWTLCKQSLGRDGFTLKDPFFILTPTIFHIDIYLR